MTPAFQEDGSRVSRLPALPPPLVLHETGQYSSTARETTSWKTKGQYASTACETTTCQYASTARETTTCQYASNVRETDTFETMGSRFTHLHTHSREGREKEKKRDGNMGGGYKDEERRRKR